MANEAMTISTPSLVTIRSSNEPQTIASSVAMTVQSSAVTVNSSGIIPAMPAIYNIADEGDSDHTLEYIESTPRSISSEDLDVLEARAEAARAAQLLADAQLRLAEARARSSRTSRGSRSSRPRGSTRSTASRASAAARASDAPASGAPVTDR